MRTLLGAFRISFFALRLGLRALKAGMVVEGIKLLMTPVGFWRFLPFSFVWREFRKYRNPRVLDASSPKLLSLFLATKTSGQVYAADLDDGKIFTRWKRFAGLLGLRNYRVEYQDARRLSYPDEFFDFIYSISVIEHIPENGDRLALAEFRRVLKPRGTLVLEVPYRREQEDIFKTNDSKGIPSTILQFYERHYDADTLKLRLELPGLSIQKKFILGERLPLDAAVLSDGLPRFFRVALLPWEPALAAVNCWAREKDDQGIPGSALLVYRKSQP